MSNALDFWTIIHGAFGYCAGKVGISRYKYLPVAVGWEVIEQQLIVKEIPEWKESKTNSIIDIIVGMLGRELGEEHQS